MFIELRQRYGANYASSRTIPIFKDLAFDTRNSDVGSFSVNVRVVDATAFGLQDQAVLEVCPNGQAGLDNTWFVIDSTTPQFVVDDEQWVTLTGRSAVAFLDDAIVYPSAYPSPIPNNHAFTNATPGFILRTFIDRAKQRGGLQMIDQLSFSGPSDSSGAAWSANQTITYNTGQTVLQVLQDLVSRQLLSFKMVGLSLYVYNYGSTNVTFTKDQIVMFAGRDIVSQTVSTDSKTWAGTVLVLGDQNHVIEKTNADTQTAVGRRREYFLSQGSIADTPTLGLLADQQLLLTNHLLTEETLEVNDFTYKPFFDYKAGDWIWRDAEGSSKQLQIQQIAISAQDEGNVKIVFALGDIIDTRAARIQKVIDAITGANGELGALPNNDGNDFVAPGAVSTVNISANPYGDSNGVALGQVTITWPAVTLNQNNTTADDIASYLVHIAVINPAPSPTPAQPPTTGWVEVGSVDSSATLAANYSGLPIGSMVYARVRAVDQAGNSGEWKVSAPVTIPNLQSTLNAPSTPTVTSGPVTLRVYWDGKDNAGNNYPSTFRYINVYRGTDVNFVPGGGNIVDSLTSSGYHVSTGLAYGTTYYFKFVAVTQQGAFTAASANGSGTPSKIITNDIADFAVTNAQIANLEVGKITSGTISADVLMGGRFKTADTGARVELNSMGLQAFNSSNTPTVAINTDGSAVITGQYKSGLSGHRIVMGGSGTGADYTLSLYTGTLNSSGSNVENRSAFTQFTQTNTDPLTGSTTTTETVSMLFNGNDTDSYGGWIKNYQDGVYSNGGARYSTDIMSLSTVFLRARSGIVNVFAESGSIFIRSTGATAYAVMRSQTTGSYGATATDSQIRADATGALLVARVYTGSDGGSAGNARNYFWIKPDSVTLRLGGAGLDKDFFSMYGDADTTPNARYIFRTSRSNNHGPFILMFSNNSYGGGFDYYDGGGNYAAAGVEVLNHAENFHPISASAFTVASSARQKTEVETYESDATAHIRDTRVVTYVRRDGSAQPTVSLVRGNTFTPNTSKARRMTGFIAEEVPEQMRTQTSQGPGVDLYAAQGIVWRALQEIDARLSDLEAGNAAG